MSRWYRLTSGNAMREFLAAVSKGSGRFKCGRYVGGSGYRGRRVRDKPHSRTQHVLPGVALDHPGSRRGTDLVGGVAVGFGVYLGAAVAGLAAVFAVVPVAYTMLKVAGGVYLLY